MEAIARQDARVAAMPGAEIMHMPQLHPAQRDAACGRSVWTLSLSNLRPAIGVGKAET